MELLNIFELKKGVNHAQWILTCRNVSDEMLFQFVRRDVVSTSLPIKLPSLASKWEGLCVKSGHYGSLKPGKLG